MVRKGWKRLFGGASGGGSKQSSSSTSILNNMKSHEKSKTMDEEQQVDESREAPEATDDEPIIEIELADQCFMRNDFDTAIELYNKVIERLQIREESDDQISGDIHVKISIILQSQGELEQALDFLVKAKNIYMKFIENLEEDESKEILATKLVEIITGIANVYVDIGEIESASNTYEESISMSRQLFTSEDKVSDALFNYGNFLSICKNEHEEAIEKLKEVLKIQTADGQMSTNSAATLNCMGRVYMRRSRLSNADEGKKDAQRAEACFLRALQLYRFSMFRNGNEKVADTLYNLNQARERQKKQQGILRNVRFEAPPQNADSFDSTCVTFSDDDGTLEESIMTALSEDKDKSWYTALGLGYLFRCGEQNVTEYDSFD
mmetsp:Transcript_124/g.168  ORF Transcript_124/g.168 Transcript_124/m.168 type:complete len:379 (+) Transcript_124:167-1303(+)